MSNNVLLKTSSERIDRLLAAYAEHHDDKYLIEARDLRVEAGKELAQLNRGKPLSPCPPVVDNPFPATRNRIPEIPNAELTLPNLAGAVRHHGALIVRDLMPAGLAGTMRSDIDRVLDASNEYFSEDPKRSLLISGSDISNDLSVEQSAWFAPIMRDQLDSHGGVEILDGGLIRGTGSVWTLVSPAVSAKLIEFFSSLNLQHLLAEYFEEEPCLSFLKSVLRRIEPLKRPSEWHQDGAFMGENIKSLNLWIALSECGAGTSSPGIDLIPTRLNGVLEATGKNDAIFDWSVSPRTISEQFSETPPQRPYFNAGDAVFFDHLNLHATSYGDAFTKRRYAIETWFFASSSYARNQIPVLL